MDKTDIYYFSLTNKYKITLALACGMFSCFFFLFFQPFGINNYRPDERITLDFVFVISGLCLMIFGSLIVIEFLLKPLFVKKWSTLQSLFIWVVFEVVLVSTVTFFFYNSLGDFHDFYFRSYLKHILEIATVIIFPILGTFFYFQHASVKKDYQEIVSLSKNKYKLEDIVLLSGDYKKDQIALNIKSIFYIESQDNYSSLNYFENGKMKRYLIRSTLSKLEKNLNSELIFRCNRSEMINLHHLESSLQKPNHITIKLKGVLRAFEVSKSRQKQLKEFLKTIV